MVRASRTLFSSLAMLMGLVGCSTSHFYSSHPAIELPPIQRGHVESSLRTLPQLPQRDSTPSAELSPYRALTAAQCQCLAAVAAVPSKLLDEETGLVGSWGKRAWIRQAVLTHTAIEIRNRAAGGALETYYRLVEAEGKSDLLNQSLSQLDKAVRETREMTAQKLKPPVALDVWTRQLLKAQGEQIQVDMTIAQLNGELRRLCALGEGGERWRIWNPEPYEVTEIALDVEAAVGEGLARRSELLLLRLLVQELDSAALPAARDLLRSVQPLLGSSRSLGAKLLALLRAQIGNRAEIETRRQQLQEYLVERETAVADEIRQAVLSLRLHTQLVAVAWAAEKSWEEKAKEVQSRQKQGLATSAEITSTTLDLLKSRGEVIQDAMAWHIAHAKLQQVQGLLAGGCDAPGHCR